MSIDWRYLGNFVFFRKFIFFRNRTLFRCHSAIPLRLLPSSFLTDGWTHWAFAAFVFSQKAENEKKEWRKEEEMRRREEGEEGRSLNVYLLGQQQLFYSWQERQTGAGDGNGLLGFCNARKLGKKGEIFACHGSNFPLPSPSSSLLFSWECCSSAQLRSVFFLVYVAIYLLLAALRLCIFLSSRPKIQVVWPQSLSLAHPGESCSCSCSSPAPPFSHVTYVDETLTKEAGQSCSFFKEVSITFSSPSLSESINPVPLALID